MNRYIIDYILDFLTYSSMPKEIQLDYTHDITHSSANVIIYPSSFLEPCIYGSVASLPQIPLRLFRGVPLLFGKPDIRKENGKLIIYADLVASVYFLISRYEELVNPGSRDEFGRLTAGNSLLGRLGLLDQPLADMYGRALRGLVSESFGIDFPESAKRFSSVTLTHDVDVPWEPFDLYTGTKRVLGNLKRTGKLDFFPVLSAMGYPERDPLYSFPYLIKADGTLPAADKIYFIKSGRLAKPYDAEPYINKKPFLRLLDKIRTSGATIGFHPSFECGVDMSLFAEELQKLEAVVGEKIFSCRHHYLNTRKPVDYRVLLDNGITGDFSMGYADQSGFRLGTTRCVRWIDPEKQALTSLVLHPLTIMDTTLLAEDYMHLNHRDAVKVCEIMIDTVYNEKGDLCLLWHNNSRDFMEQAYSHSVYREALEKIKSIIQQDKGIS